MHPVGRTPTPSAAFSRRYTQPAASIVQGAWRDLPVEHLSAAYIARTIKGKVDRESV
jgi:hypothetical protein